MLHDAAVIVPTTLRPSLARALRSVYAQDFAGRVQIMLGIDVATGSRALLRKLRDECPQHMTLTVLDLGYSTSKRHGGFYPAYGGGALRTVLSYAANARHVAYLDDDNWWAPSHLSDLTAAIKGHDCAWSYRWYVHPKTQQPMCIDRWESVGPGRGVYRKKFDGFIDTNCWLLDKRKCHWMLPAWCIPTTRRGEGEDRIVYERLRKEFRMACTRKATAYYVIRELDLPVIERFIARRARLQAQRGESPSPDVGSAPPAGIE